MNLHLKNVLNLFKPCFRPQQGVNYYEFTSEECAELIQAMFPSPTGVNYYELQERGFLGKKKRKILFPSPTGVNYYEYDKDFYYSNYNGLGFRPQQGLTIMNL